MDRRKLKSTAEAVIFACGTPVEAARIAEGLGISEEEAFDVCDELAYVRIPNSLKRLGSWAFDDCPRLYISLPSKWKGYDSKYETKPMHSEYR